MPKKKKGEKKSLSVNDIPVAKNTTQLMKELDEEAFGKLLNQCSQSTYNRKSEGALNTINDEEHGILNILEKSLRDEDAEKERMKQEKNPEAPTEQHLPRDYSSSPPVNRTIGYAPPRKSTACFQAFNDDDKLDYIDSNATDVEMQDLTHLNTVRRFHSNCWTRGNDELICKEYKEEIDETIPPKKEILPFFDESGYIPRPYTELKPNRTANKELTSQHHEQAKVETTVEKKKRLLKEKRQKQNKNSYVQGNCMGDTALDDLVKYIDTTDSKNDSAPLARRRTTKDTKKGTSIATIGNHQGKAQAAAPSNKPQTVNGTASAKENKKSPNKKNKKGSNSVSNNNTAPRNVGRVSTEDAEEEFLSADEGIVSSNSDDVNLTAIPPSDVMMDGGNYLADADDLPCLENHNIEEQEFITVGSRDKKKKGSTAQTQRTGSTGKVERRSNVQRPEVQQQPRRNSMEDRPKARPRPQAAASLGDYLDEKKTQETHHHHKTKPAPFKERKKHARLESTADSEYMDAQDEMVILTPISNGTTTPERGFSYADAAKKSAEQSRENSPACVNQTSGSPTDTPPPLEQNSTPTSSKYEEFPPVSMPHSSEKTTDNAAGLSFFYEENATTDSQSRESFQPEGSDGAFVLKLDGKTVRFAFGMAAPVTVQPVDEHHRAMITLMLNRWQMFTSTGPAPVYYSPNPVVQV